MLRSVVIAVLTAYLIDASVASSLSERLFARSLNFANRSLTGRFIREMANGTLPKNVYKQYLWQDNLYLGQYARAFAVLAAKAEKGNDIVWLLNRSIEYLGEHDPAKNSFADTFVFERDAMPVTIAYTSLFGKAAWSSSAIESLAAVLPCQKLYDYLFATLKKTTPAVPGNPYQKFIDQYADPSNHAVTKALEAMLDKLSGEHLSAHLEDRAQWYYTEAMRYEAEFFEQGFAKPDSLSVTEVHLDAFRGRGSFRKLSSALADFKEDVVKESGSNHAPDIIIQM